MFSAKGFVNFKSVVKRIFEQNNYGVNSNIAVSSASWSLFAVKLLFSFFKQSFSNQGVTQMNFL